MRHRPEANWLRQGEHDRTTEHPGIDERGNHEIPGVTLVSERPPLREGKVFVDYDERAIIVENLEAAYVALNQAFRGIWVEKAMERGHVREYWDDGDVAELESLTLEASVAVENAWRALTAVIDAHGEQEEAELAEDDD